MYVLFLSWKDTAYYKAGNIFRSIFSVLCFHYNVPLVVVPIYFPAILCRVCSLSYAASLNCCSSVYRQNWYRDELEEQGFATEF